MRVVEDDYIAHFKVFPDGQDHLAEVQCQRHQGVGQDQGLPQRVNFWENFALIGVVQDCSG